MHTKFVFITGGVVSSLGKGIIAASLGKLLQARGLKVTIQKFDPYINIDPGTGLVEVVELPTHPFFIGVQFHPEYKSTPERPHPLFQAFVQACKS